ESIAGYDLLDGRFEFVIALGQEERTEIELENALTTGAVRLVKVGEEGEALENAIFNLVDEDGEEVVSGLETNDSGIIEVNDLKPGTYYFVETGAPFGHDLDPTPIEVTVVFDQQEIAEVAKTNERTTSGVELTKVDSETGERLVDATFELQTTEGEFISEHVTDEAGQIVVEGLKPGHYQFVETEAPFGYELDQRPILFAIDLGQITNTQISTDNQIVTGDFELTKLDFDNGHVLAGVEFELQAANGEFIEAGLTTDADGKLLLTGLRPGSYQLIETRALPGYQLLAGPIAFTIDRGQLAQKEIVITNMLTRGSVQLIKQNEAGNVLADAIFTLLDANGNELKAGLTTNEAGLIIVTDLRPGSYQFIETEAPEGYQLDNTPIDFEIEVGQVEILSINVTNEKIEVEPTGSTDIGESNSEREPKQQTDLPNTATQVYNVMTIGVSILLLGGILLTIRKKRKDF
ncbi:LPXTG-motif cell wall anchor domain-containing protein, partial [Amphibacillus marinus]